MTMKGYLTFPKAPGVEPHHQMQFSVISMTLIGEAYPSAELCVYKFVYIRGFKSI